jgi:hypothetical protein
MLTATRIGAIEADDIVELLPALINASTTVTKAVDQMSDSVTGAITHVTSAVDRLSVLPEQFVREAKVGVEDVSYAAGRGFGRGAGWNMLPPVLIGAGFILAGLFAYKYASIQLEKKAGLAPAYAT